jgi:hypothetical protein
MCAPASSAPVEKGLKLEDLRIALVHCFNPFATMASCFRAWQVVPADEGGAAPPAAVCQYSSIDRAWTLKMPCPGRRRRRSCDHPLHGTSSRHHHDRVPAPRPCLPLPQGPPGAEQQKEEERKGRRRGIKEGSGGTRPDGRAARPIRGEEEEMMHILPITDLSMAPSLPGDCHSSGGRAGRPPSCSRTWSVSRPLIRGTSPFRSPSWMSRPRSSVRASRGTTGGRSRRWVDPAHRLVGTGLRMRHVKVRTVEEAGDSILKELLKEEADSDAPSSLAAIHVKKRTTR